MLITLYLIIFVKYALLTTTNMVNGMPAKTTSFSQTLGNLRHGETLSEIDGLLTGVHDFVTILEGSTS